MCESQRLDVCSLRLLSFAAMFWKAFAAVSTTSTNLADSCGPRRTDVGRGPS